MTTYTVTAKNTGAQVRRYGPCVYDVEINIVNSWSGDKWAGYNDSVFKDLFRKVFRDFKEGEREWHDWYLVKFERVDRDTAHIIVQQDYLD